ncbi:SprB repeat-containing protein [Candidatus Amoebophilus asiaticus]|nr:SprB repeat-containing protein [Candidatus Amoebophilus asiaticus]
MKMRFSFFLLFCLIGLYSYSQSIQVYVTSITHVSCNGASDGSAHVSASGGLLPYTYSWSTGSVDSFSTGLAGGTYFLTVYDANMYSALDTVIINEPDPINISFTKLYDEICGMSDGSATASPSNGTLPYTFAWSNGSSDSTLIMLTGGTYVVTVTDFMVVTQLTVYLSPACLHPAMLSGRAMQIVIRLQIILTCCLSASTMANLALTDH